MVVVVLVKLSRDCRFFLFRWFSVVVDSVFCLVS